MCLRHEHLVYPVKIDCLEYTVFAITLICMNKKHQYIILQQLFGSNSGVWTLIMIHLFILAALVFLFHDIISRLQGF